MFSEQVVDVVIEGTDVRKGSLDPLGKEQDIGPEGYYKLMDDFVDSFVSCVRT